MGLPDGVVTFMFTDIEGSTQKWDRDAEAMASAIAIHDGLFHEAIGSRDGTIVKSMGDGLMAVFADPGDAVAAAIEAQRALLDHSWDDPIDELRVRIGVHTGPGEPANGDYLGPSVNRTARLEAAGHGGQILASAATRELIGDRLDGVGFRDLGEHALRGLTRMERIFQVDADDLPGEFPPLRTASTPTNLPADAATLVGRRTELDELSTELDDTRSLTITGAGGVGKTTIAIEAARRRLSDHPGGVWLFELAPLADGRHIATEALGAMRRPADASREPEEVLLDFLESQHSLLVFDNCEHLRSDAARLIAAIIRRAPHVSVLATSREPLGIDAERVWPIPTMSLPDGTGLDELEASDAGALFLARASAAGADLTLDDETARTVASICETLDGLPLAIELAAARLRSMSIQELDRRLDDRFQLLRSRGHTEVPHHRTLRDTVAWSYDLLATEDQQLYRQLSVFAGGFDAEAAEAVAGSDADVIEGLDQLVNQSLIEVDRGATTRFRMLETIRQYGTELLREEGTLDEASRAHLEWVLALAKEGARGIEGRDQAQWLRRFRAEIANIRVALAWAREHDPVTGGTIASALSRFFWMYASESDSELEADSTSFLREGYEWSTAMLEAGGDDLPEVLRARLQLGIGGLLCVRIGRFDEALERLAEAREVFERRGDERSLGWVTFYEGIASFGMVSLEESISIMERALELHSAAQDPVGSATAMLLIGGFTSLKDPAAGRPLLERFAAGANKIRSPLALGHAADMLALNDALGDTIDGETHRLAAEALIRLRGINSYACICHSLGGAAAVLGQAGDIEGSARALGLIESIRNRLSMAIAPYEERSSYVRDIVGNETDSPEWARALAEGRTFEPDEGIDWVIGRLGHDPAGLKEQLAAG